MAEVVPAEVVAVGQVLDDGLQLRQGCRTVLWIGLVLPSPRMCAGLYGISGFGLADAAVPSTVRRGL